MEEEEEEESGMMKKGPWKPEEDEILKRHVSRCGPREWSSILSKGLLQRNGKSCRLRWVNKLRPDLKIGCKFSEEEERIIIDLQSKFGNKWARIATHLQGRTDNDVKNFWSSRQKKLARIIRLKSSSSSSSDSSSTSTLTPKPSSSSRTRKGKNVKTEQGLGFVKEEIKVASSSKILRLPSNNVDATLVTPELDVKFKHEPSSFRTAPAVAETDSSLYTESNNQQLIIPFSLQGRHLLANKHTHFLYITSDYSEDPFFEVSPVPKRRIHGSKDDEEFSDDFPGDFYDRVDPIQTP
ncbi:unnamed protein product [Cochlearia groenlandica]